MPNTTLLVHALLIGMVSGMRTMTGLAALSWFGGPALGWLDALWARILLTLLAAGELVGDKLPKTPSRLAPGPLGARLVIGGLCGALLLKLGGGPLWIGAGLGALGAGAGAFAFNRLRGFAVRATKQPDLIFALIEDLLAIGLAIWVVR